MNISPSLIVFYNTGFGAPLSFYYPHTILEGTSCEISTDRNRLEQADAVVFHLPDLGDISHLRKRPGQLWVLWCQECDQNYTVLLDKEAIALADIKMTYHLDSDVTHGYFRPAFKDTFRKAIPPKSTNMLASIFMSSMINKSGRLNYVKELMQYMEVHSYGKMFQNRTLTSDTGHRTKLEVISKYKFYLAFENACGRDYVTEKFYDAFEAGTVPVYLGACNVDEFAPGEHSYINVADFETPAALASYLHELNEDDNAYYAYFEWKKYPFKEPFNTLVEEPRISLFHNLYEEVKKRMQRI